MSAVTYNIFYVYDEQFVGTITRRFDFSLDYV